MPGNISACRKANGQQYVRTYPFPGADVHVHAGLSMISVSQDSVLQVLDLPHSHRLQPLHSDVLNEPCTFLEAGLA